MYECPNCGRNLKFDIASQMMKCEYCDTKISPYEAVDKHAAIERPKFGNDASEDGIYDNYIAKPGVDDSGVNWVDANDLNADKQDAASDPDVGMQDPANADTESVDGFNTGFGMEDGFNTGFGMEDGFNTGFVATPKPDGQSAESGSEANDEASAVFENDSVYEEDNGVTYQVTVFTCPQCGGEIIGEENEAATFCSYCGASTILKSRIANVKCPEFVIPFKRTKTDCAMEYKKFVNKAWFAPKEVKDPAHIDGFRGIYMPYWIYDLQRDGDVTFEGKRVHQSGNYEITDHYDLTSRLIVDYKGVTFDASSGFSDNLSGAIAPFDMTDKQPFSSAFLSGFYADVSDVPAKVYADNAQDAVSNDVASEIASHPKLRKYSVPLSNVKTRIKPNVTNVDSAMFPVWFMSYRNHNNQTGTDRVVYAVVNGQTGKVAADMPIDIKKYFITSFIVAIPIFLLYNMAFTFMPQAVMWISVILATIATIVYGNQSNKIVEWEVGGDDEGLMAVRGLKYGRTVKDITRKEYTDSQIDMMVRSKTAARFTPLLFMPIVLRMFANLYNAMGSAALPILLFIFVTYTIFAVVQVVRLSPKNVMAKYQQNNGVVIKSKSRKHIAPLIACIILAIIMQVANPASDIPFYVAAIASMGLVVTFVVKIVGRYNILATRPLPQFNKKGGDDRADFNKQEVEKA